MYKKPVICSILLLFLLCSWISNTSAAEHVWRFEDQSAIDQWIAVRGSKEPDPMGYIKIRGFDTFWFVSPPHLQMPADKSFVEFRLRVPSTYLKAYVIMKTAEGRTWQKEFRYGMPGSFHLYTLDISADDLKDEMIDSFAFGFGSVEEVDLEHVKIYVPTLFQRVSLIWSRFWDVDYIQSTTVNFVETPFLGALPLPGLIYLFLPLMVLGILVVRRRLDRSAIINALIISFLIGGILFALRMDYTWFSMFRLDRAVLGGKSMPERISLVEGTGTYEFAQHLKEIIHPEEEVRIYAGKLESKLKYYLLPVKTSSHGRYIAVYEDGSITFRPEEHILMKKGKIIERKVSRIADYQSRAALYRIDASEGK